MSRIFYVGDWAVQCGPIFAETPFNYAWKGLDLFNYGRWLKDALESTGEHTVTSVATWDFYKMGPGEYEKVLADYDVLIFSDVEAKCFQLAPAFFDRSKFGKEPLTFPDRVRLTAEAIEAGTGAIFCGGWLSFTGEMGKGGWGRTRLAEVLPVTCLDTEDLRESTEGFTVGRHEADHPIFQDVPLQTLPPILGYNRVRPREGAEVLSWWSGGDDPMLAVDTFGRGRSLAYTSDPAPHWGCNFVYWDHSARFWSRALEWVLGRL
ncbi:MAG: glutamine amidotransferase [Phycisphaeraceae bacterium]